GLRGDAVSPSNAVGFWQFKDFSAREVKLEVNEIVDERKHIFRSSIGAARYFYKNYRRYANWVYAVISYYAGGTGAMPHIDPQYIGKDEMVVTEGLHWYAQKAIAHKIAFEPFYGKTQPVVWLEPFVVGEGSERILVNLAKKNGVDLQDFRAYNLWICSHTIPADGTYSYYVPRREGTYAHRPDPFLKAYSPEPGPPLPQKTLADLDPEPTPQPVRKHETQPEDRPVFFAAKKIVPAQAKTPEVRRLPVEKDPFYDREFVLPHPTADNLVDIAQRHGISLKKLQKWNRLSDDDLYHPPRKLVLLVPPRKANVHVASKFENLHEIALMYRKNVHTLMNYNRIEDANRMLIEGQKIYLRDYRPNGEPTIVYDYGGSSQKTHATHAFAMTNESPPTVETPQIQTESAQSQEPLYSTQTIDSPAAEADSADAPKLIDRSAVRTVRPAPSPDKYIYYVVQPKETLYSISKKFGMTVEELRAWNGMSDYNLKIGQKIKVRG
ncbi:MAG: LysM peptidoglycan-binding domain-containing protein, partial [Bacteroidia bacterium]|nr:LysM peptidoglycan-binding domain-containing protein [Bacteroidia bacterium]